MMVDNPPGQRPPVDAEFKINTKFENFASFEAALKKY